MWTIFLILICGAAGLYLLLTATTRELQRAGQVLAGVSMLALVAVMWDVLSPLAGTAGKPLAASTSARTVNSVGQAATHGTTLEFFLQGILMVFAGVGGVCVVICRRATHAILGFGLTLVATAGLCLCADAQYLALMVMLVGVAGLTPWYLAVIRSFARHGIDTQSGLPQEPLLACLLAACLCGAIWASVEYSIQPGSHRSARPYHLLTQRAIAARSRAAHQGDLPHSDAPQVASFGVSLSRHHLLPVAVAGMLIFVGLVGLGVLLRDTETTS